MQLPNTAFIKPCRVPMLLFSFRQRLCSHRICFKKRHRNTSFKFSFSRRVISSSSTIPYMAPRSSEFQSRSYRCPAKYTTRGRTYSAACREFQRRSLYHLYSVELLFQGLTDSDSFEAHCRKLIDDIVHRLAEGLHLFRVACRAAGFFSVTIPPRRGMHGSSLR